MSLERALRDRYEDPDRSEVDRADALLAFFGLADAGAGSAIVDDARAALVDILNEPLSLLPRLAHELLGAYGPTIVGADVSRQRIALCPHGEAALVADADSDVTGRFRCMDCDRVVVAVDDVFALAAELEFGCGFFTGPPLRQDTERGIIVDSRFITMSELTVGAGHSDTIINAGVPAGGLTINVDAAGAVVATADKVAAFVRAPVWLLGSEHRPHRVEYALARPRCVLPPVADVAVYRRGDVDAKPGVVTINRAFDLMTQVSWEGFGVSRLLRVGESVILSFDRRFIAVRTVDEVMVLQADQAQRAISLAPHELRPLAIGDATITWTERGIIVRGCPPPRSRGVNLALFVNGPLRRR